MIRCLFVQISRNESGQAIRKELLVAGGILQIGRGPECNILLPDHRVNLHHAVIRRSSDRKLYIEKSEGSTLRINGSFALSAELKPGTHVLIGPYDLIVESPFDNYDLVLSAEITTPPDEVADAAASQGRATLATSGLSRRKLAIGLAAITALLFLLLPMAPMPGPAFPKALNSFQASLIKSWQIGETSRGHHLVGAKCDSCHEHAFRSVPDEACENCHKAVARHVNDKALHERAFPNLRCTDCHQEHRGEAGLVIPDRQCVQCHGKIKKIAEKTEFQNISDFGANHPAFKLTFRSGPTEKDVIRIPQSEKAKLKERTGMKFSHKVHLDKEGVSSPEGDTVLSCPDCHKKDASNDQFIPITMEKSCQQFGCHSLDFKPPVPKRHLTHGSERKLMIELHDYYSSAITAMVASGENIPCKEGVSGKSQLERALACARIRARENAEILFSKDRGCGECHEIVIENPDDRDAPWKVAPLAITNKWFPNAHFPHGKHSTTKCLDCHEKSKSEKSDDLAIPGIENCRECHAGGKRAKHKVGNRCANCHNFHTAKLLP